jgi:hypothetical protein
MAALSRHRIFLSFLIARFYETDHGYRTQASGEQRLLHAMDEQMTGKKQG